MKTTFGRVKESQIEIAKIALRENFKIGEKWMEENIWFERPHQGNLVRGAYTYSKPEEVLERESEAMVTEFSSVLDIENIEPEIIAQIKTILEKNKTAYLLETENYSKTSDDLESLCFDEIEDGQYLWYGTIKEAYEILSSHKKYDFKIKELITIGVFENLNLKEEDYPTIEEMLAETNPTQTLTQG